MTQITAHLHDRCHAMQSNNTVLSLYTQNYLTCNAGESPTIERLDDDDDLQMTEADRIARISARLSSSTIFSAHSTPRTRLRRESAQLERRATLSTPIRRTSDVSSSRESFSEAAAGAWQSMRSHRESYHQLARKDTVPEESEGSEGSEGSEDRAWLAEGGVARSDGRTASSTSATQRR